jgi:hypothetical protein
MANPILQNLSLAREAEMPSYWHNLYAKIVMRRARHGKTDSSQALIDATADEQPRREEPAEMAMTGCF